MIERGTLPHQRAVTGTLATLPSGRRAEMRRRDTVVGPVAGSPTARVARAASLTGQTVAVTRARAQTSELARRLRELGAEVVQAPVIRIQPLADGGTGLQSPPLDLSPYDLICLTSPNGVAQLFERLAQSDRHPTDARALAGASVAAIGPGTAGRWPSTASPPTSSPSATWPSRWWGAGRAADPPRAGRPAREARDVLPTPCGPAAPRWTCWPCTKRSPSRSPRRRSPRRWPPTTSPSRHPRPCASS